MEDADYLVEVDCSKAFLVGWVDRLQEALLFWVTFADSEGSTHSYMSAFAARFLQLTHKLLCFFDGAAVIFLTAVLEQRVIHDELVQFCFSVTFPPSDAINREVVLRNGTEFLFVLGSLGELAACGERQSLDMVVRLRGECPLIEARILENVLEFLVERRLYFPEILMKLL